MSINKRIINNVFWLMLSEVGSKGLVFLCTIYLARVLGKDGFGLYSLSLAVGIYFMMVADMGVMAYGTREVAKNRGKAKELYSTLNSLRFILALILNMIFGAVLFFIDIPVEKKIILMAGSFYSVACSLSAEWVLRGLEKMQYILIGRAASSIFLIIGLVLMVENRSDVITASIIYSSSFLAGSLAYMVFLIKKLKMPFLLKVSFSEWLFHAKEFWYFAINGICNNIAYFVPIFFMGILSTNEDLGIFSASHRLIIIIINTGTLIIVALYPTLSNLYTKDKEGFRKVQTRLHKTIVGISLPICIIASIFGEEIIVFLYGVSYTESGIIFNSIVWLSFFAFIRRSVGTSLLSAGFHKFNMYATGAGAIVTTLFSVLLIQRYSGHGAVWALIIGEVVTMIVMSIIFRQKVYNTDFIIPYFVKALIAGIVMYLCIVSLSFPKLVNAMVGIIVYTFISLYTGMINKETIRKVGLTIVKR